MGLSLCFYSSSWMGKSKLKLGYDIDGGVHVAVQVIIINDPTVSGSTHTHYYVGAVQLPPYNIPTLAALAIIILSTSPSDRMILIAMSGVVLYMKQTPITDEVASIL